MFLTLEFPQIQGYLHICVCVVNMVARLSMNATNAQMNLVYFDSSFYSCLPFLYLLLNFVDIDYDHVYSKLTRSEDTCFLNCQSQIDVITLSCLTGTNQVWHVSQVLSLIIAARKIIDDNVGGARSRSADADAQLGGRAPD
jgi:hypothetical protein